MDQVSDQAPPKIVSGLPEYCVTVVMHDDPTNPGLRFQPTSTQRFSGQDAADAWVASHADWLVEHAMTVTVWPIGRTVSGLVTG